jgi:hypothetical protein
MIFDNNNSILLAINSLIKIGACVHETTEINRKGNVGLEVRKSLKFENFLKALKQEISESM